MAHQYELSCVKTGRWWPVASVSAGRRKAHSIGLVDYEIKPAVTA